LVRIHRCFSWLSFLTAVFMVRTPRKLVKHVRLFQQSSCSQYRTIGIGSFRWQMKVTERPIRDNQDFPMDIPRKADIQTVHTASWQHAGRYINSF
jgi:hypothetical protein